MYTINIFNIKATRIAEYVIDDEIEAYDLYYGLHQGRNSGDRVTIKVTGQGYLLDKYDHWETAYDADTDDDNQY